MLRLDVDHAKPICDPADEPLRRTMPAARPEIWAYGLRNPWRFSFDRGTGDLYHRRRRARSDWRRSTSSAASSPGRENYGWRLMEGKSCYNPPQDCNDGTLKLPIIVYPHSHNGDFIGCAVIGGYRYRGPSFPALNGVYFFGDDCTGRLWATFAQGGSRNLIQIAETGLNITSFGEDDAGDQYMVEIGGNGLYKLVDAQTGITR